MPRRWPLPPANLASRTRHLSNTRAAMARTYADAVAALNTLQSNFAIVDAIRKSGRKMNEQAIPEMVEWWKKIGYKPSDLDSLNAIHIAGTKGKGSTAAFISSILDQLRLARKDESHSPKKIGLYTSPHLRFVRERIQINGAPLTEEQFTKYFFDTWDRLEDAASAEGSDPKDRSAKPVYFRFLTLMAFHAYKSEGVDAAVIECGIGGAYDSTNILESPSVTGITSLGIDHVGVLGDTLAEIAWHKAGVMKRGTKCFTPQSQLPEAKEVMETVARGIGAEVVYVDVDQDIQSGKTELGLQAEFQKINASVAVAIAHEYLSQQGIQETPETQALTLKGLESVRWPGRCESRNEPGITWCIDGGHTLESIDLAGKWFASKLLLPRLQPQSTDSRPTPGSRRTRYLIFNQQTRDASALARALHTTLSDALKAEQPFTHVIFCTNTTFRDSGFKPDLVSLNVNASDLAALTVQKQLANTWREIDPNADVTVVSTIEEAVALVRARRDELRSNRNEQQQKVQDEAEILALVTGSLHLVGGFLEVLESSPQPSS